MKCLHIFPRIVKMRKTYNIKYHGGYRQLAHSYGMAVEIHKIILETTFILFIKVEHINILWPSYDPVIGLLLYQIEMHAHMHPKKYMKVYTAALFFISAKL